MFSFLSDLGNWALLVYLSPLVVAGVVIGVLAWRLPKTATLGWEDSKGFHRGERSGRVYSFQVERERRRASFR